MTGVGGSTIVSGVSHLVVIDPGLGTGMAYFRDGKAIWCITTSPPHTDLAKRLRKMQETVPTLEVVCEQGPTNHRRQAEACAPVEHMVRDEAKVLHWVRPSDWKKHPKAVVRPEDPMPRTRHERDVLRIGRWFLATRLSSLVHGSA